MGWINDTFHWNYAFLLDFPFLAMGAFLIWKFVPWGYLYMRSDEEYVDTWGAGLLDRFAGILADCHEPWRARSMAGVIPDRCDSG